MAIDVDKLLRSLNEGSSSRPGSNDRVKSTLTDQQQADKLLEGLVAFTSPKQYKPGDFVRYRAECGSYVRYHSRLHIVLQNVDPPIKVPLSEDNEGNCVAYRNYDLLVGTSDPHQENGILKYYADSRDMEPYPDGDRLKRRGTA